MTIKSFFIGLLIAFVIYEVVSITIGVIKNKRKQKNEETEDKKDVSNQD